MKLNKSFYIIMITVLVLIAGLGDLKAKIIRTVIPGTKIEVIAEVDVRGKIIYIIDYIDSDPDPD